MNTFKEVIYSYKEVNYSKFNLLYNEYKMIGWFFKNKMLIYKKPKSYNWSLLNFIDILY